MEWRAFDFVKYYGDISCPSNTAPTAGTFPSLAILDLEAGFAVAFQIWGFNDSLPKNFGVTNKPLVT